MPWALALDSQLQAARRLERVAIRFQIPNASETDVRKARVCPETKLNVAKVFTVVTVRASRDHAHCIVSTRARDPFPYVSCHVQQSFERCSLWKEANGAGTAEFRFIVVSQSRAWSCCAPRVWPLS
jgi:hypothetical protein